MVRPGQTAKVVSGPKITTSNIAAATKIVAPIYAAQSGPGTTVKPGIIGTLNPTQIQAANIKAVTGSTPTVLQGPKPTTAQKIENLIPTPTVKTTQELEIQSQAVAIFNRLAAERAAKEGRAVTPSVTYTAQIPIKQTGTDTFVRGSTVLTGAIELDRATAAAVQVASATAQLAAKQAIITPPSVTTVTGEVKQVLNAPVTQQLAPSGAVMNIKTQAAAVNVAATRESTLKAQLDALVPLLKNPLTAGQATQLMNQYVAQSGLYGGTPTAQPKTIQTVTPTQQSLTSTILGYTNQFITLIRAGVQSRISQKAGR